LERPAPPEDADEIGGHGWARIALLPPLTTAPRINTAEHMRALQTQSALITISVTDFQHHRCRRRFSCRQSAIHEQRVPHIEDFWHTTPFRVGWHAGIVAGC
jgi:hypothetical protein